MLHNVKEEYLNSAGRTLDKAIKKNFRGDAKDLLRQLVRGNGCAEEWSADAEEEDEDDEEEEEEEGHVVYHKHGLKLN